MKKAEVESLCIKGKERRPGRESSSGRGEGGVHGFHSEVLTHRAGESMPERVVGCCINGGKGL